MKAELDWRQRTLVERPSRFHQATQTPRRFLDHVPTTRPYLDHLGEGEVPPLPRLGLVSGMSSQGPRPNAQECSSVLPGQP